MTELERALVELGRAVEFPTAPDLAARVRERLGPRRRALPRWALAVALVALAIGIAFAVPPARSAILRLFHIGGATVIRVETLPPAEERALAADLGTPESVAYGAAALGGRALVPPGTRRVYVFEHVVSMLVRGPVLLSELAVSDPGFLKKYTGANSVEGVEVGRYYGLWIEGRHVVVYPGAPARFAGNVLVWQREGLTLRLEGPKLRKDEALRIAESLREITR
jgi:hypothetical protein